MPKRARSDKDRQRLGDDYASVLMLSQQALAKHLDASPEVARQLDIARMQVLSDAEFASLMQQAAAHIRRGQPILRRARLRL